MSNLLAEPARLASLRAKLLDGGPKKLLIGGEWVDAASGKTIDSVNPANGQVIAKIAAGGKEDVDRAVAAARKAFEGPWSRMSPYERQALMLRYCDLLDKHFDELMLLDTLDMGAPFGRVSKQAILGRLRFCAGLATALHGETINSSLPGEFFTCTVKEPIGVVGAIIPWNGPMNATAWKLGPVLATGCTVVLKPAEDASLTPLRMVELALEAGVPPGVINVVTGYGHEAGQAIAEHMDIDKVAFTGSTETGRRVVQASSVNMKRLSIELGGKSPNIIFDDADLDAAVPVAAMAVFGNSGQVCCAGTRLFVQEGVYDDFVARVADFARTLVVGDGLDAATQIGPLVSAKQLERVSSYMEIGKNEGATALAGGTRLTQGNLNEGYFVSPTVFGGVKDDMRIAREEIFGPVLSAIPFKDFDEVVGRANATPYGLGSGVWTRDINKAHRIASRIRAGSVWINSYNLFDAAIPFGGYKQSGYGRESGIQHLEEFLQVKAIGIKLY